IGNYNSIRDLGGMSTQYLFETNQLRIGATLWQRPHLYIDNSPIFRANKVITPLLLMNNKNDQAVPWSQGVEWFLALRRLSKRVWMLQYDGEDHTLYKESNKLDYSIRLSHFFNHFLKNNPPPFWRRKE